MEAVFKQFVSEKQIEEAKQKRQEEWEKVRRPDQPLGKQKLIMFYNNNIMAERDVIYL